jgi:deoxyribonuclease-4
VKEITEEDSLAFRSRRLQLNISPVFIHTSYLINLASRDVLLRKKSSELVAEEMNRADAIGAEYVILHTGSAGADDPAVARKRAIDALNRLSLMGRWKTELLIENTAGERGDISSCIEDLAEILDGVERPPVAGVCLDTCHAYAAGYDFGGEKGMLSFLDEAEKSGLLRKVKLIHLNDSMGDAGSRTDRHEHIGKGKIGAEGLARFINARPLGDLPLILETPKKGPDDDPMNLERVRKMITMKR